jgi:hypothetical protein
VAVSVRTRPTPVADLPTVYAVREGRPRPSIRLARPTGLRDDSLFLVAVVVLSLVLYLGGLGFSGADWLTLQELGNAPQRSLGGLVQAAGIAQPQMPALQLWYVASLYRLFGPQPLGYHAVGVALLLAAILLARLLLQELGLPRLMTVAIPATVALLLGDFRGGFSAFGGELGLALCVLSLFAEVRALGRGLRWFWLWKPVALLSLVAASQASEAVVALLLAGQLLTWQRVRVLDGPELLRLGRARAALARAAILLSMLAAAGAFVRASAGSLRGGLQVNHPEQAPWLFGRAVATQLVAQLLSLPSQVEWVLRHGLVYLPTLGVAAVGGLLLGAYLWRVAGPASSTTPKRPAWLILTLIGLAVFSAGEATRTATGVVPGAGVAMAVVGSAGFLSTFVPTDLLRREVLSVLLTLLCVGGFTATGAAAVSSEATYAPQHATAQNLAERLPRPPSGSTILFEEACLSPASGEVLSADQLAGLLAVTYHDPSIRGVILTSRVTAGQDRLTMASTAGVSTSYPYGDRLFVYNAARRSAYRLQSSGQASRYFLTYPDRTAGCAERG